MRGTNAMAHSVAANARRHKRLYSRALHPLHRKLARRRLGVIIIEVKREALCRCDVVARHR